MSQRTSGDTIQLGTCVGSATLRTVLSVGEIWTRYIATDEAHGEVWVWELFPRLIVRRDGLGEVHSSDGKQQRFEEMRATLREDIKNLQELNHPALVRILAFHETLGTCFVVTAPVEGRNIADALQARTPLTVSSVISIAESIAGALIATHQKKVCLIDIDDRSVFLSVAGKPVITAFGVDPSCLRPDPPQPVSSDANTTADDTVSVYPPELSNAQNASRRIGVWTDIYLASALIKRLMIDCRALETARKSDAQQNSDAATSEEKTEFAPFFVRAVEHALKPLPEHRPRSAAQWLRELRGEEAVVVRHRFEARHGIGFALAAILIAALSASELIRLRLETKTAWNAEVTAWDNTGLQVPALEAFVKNYPGSVHAAVAREHIAKVGKEADAKLKSASQEGEDALHAFVNTLKYYGTPAHAAGSRQLRLLQEENERRQVDQAFQAMDRKNRQDVSDFLRKYKNDRNAKSRGYLGAAITMLMAMGPEEPPTEPGHVPIDDAFASLDQTNLKQLNKFIEKYWNHKHAIARGYVARAESWREAARWHAENEEEKKRQKSVEWVFD